MLRNTDIISQNEYDNVRIEYEKIIKVSVIPKGNDVILYEIWNVYNSQKFPNQGWNKKRSKTTKRRIPYDKNKQMISRKASRMAKENPPKNEGKHNVSLIFSNVKKYKKEDFLVDNIE